MASSIPHGELRLIAWHAVTHEGPQSSYLTLRTDYSLNVKLSTTAHAAACAFFISPEYVISTLKLQARVPIIA